MKPAPRLLLITGLGSMLAACGTGGGTTSQPALATSPTAFVLTEWSIAAPTTPLHPGKVLVTASNRGRETHELVIVRADAIASLPTKPDGSVDEEKISDTAKPGEIADIKPGTTISKTIDLAPGNYVAICNLVETMGPAGGMGDMSPGDGMGGMGTAPPGHIHVQLGMVARFTVA